MERRKKARLHAAAFYLLQRLVEQPQVLDMVLTMPEKYDTRFGG